MLSLSIELICHFTGAMLRAGLQTGRDASLSGSEFGRVGLLVSLPPAVL